MKRRSPLVFLLVALLVCAFAGGVGAQQGERRRRGPRRTPRPAPAAPASPAQAAASAHGSLTDDIPCGACHTPEGWAMSGGSSGRASGFDHARTGFPLSGRHLGAGCTECHRPGQEVRRECVSCHQDGHQGRLGMDCSRCHSSVSFQDARALEIHRTTRLPLTGMHAMAACADCHRRTGDRGYSAVPAECIACHDDDYRRPETHPRHDGGGGAAAFPRDCTQCHRTTSWSPAIVDTSLIGGAAMGLTERAPASHELRFPLRTGPHQGASCESCHENPRIPAAIRCVGCHAHSPARLASQHVSVRPGPDGRGCLGCHPGGIAR